MYVLTDVISTTVCTTVCTYVRMYVCVCVCACACVCVCLCLCLCLCFLRVRVRVRVRVRARARACVRVCACACACTLCCVMLSHVVFDDVTFGFINRNHGSPRKNARICTKSSQMQKMSNIFCTKPLTNTNNVVNLIAKRNGQCKTFVNILVPDHKQMRGHHLYDCTKS